MKLTGTGGTRLGNKLTALVAAALVVAFVCIAFIAQGLYRNVYDDATADQVSTIYGILEKSNQETANNVWVADEAIFKAAELSDYIMTRSELGISFIVRAACDGKNISAVFFNDKGEKIWATTSMKMAAFDPSVALAGQRKQDLFKTENGLVYRAISPAYSDTHKTKVIGGYILEYELRNVGMVDSVKEQAAVEAMIYAGDTAITTTIIDENEERVLDTLMDAHVAARVLEQGEVYANEEMIAGQKMQVQYAPLKDSAGQVLGALFVGMPLKAADSRFFKSTLTVMISEAVLLGLVILLIIALLRKYVFKPLGLVSGVMNQLSAGNLHADHVELDRNDEFGDLANGMNILVSQLQTYIDDINVKVSAMAEADYTVRTGVDYIGDFRAIDDALKGIRANMGKMFAALNDSAEQVYNGSMQISKSAQLLAEGSATQAGTIEELSASIQEIATNVMDSAENVQQVSKLYSTMGDRINDQDHHMDQVLAAMNEIEVNSSKIQNIIRTIEDIAFQTNILALNAAVEAARAGESGKGFAVVAEEVRSLAGKSAKAANETTELISGTITSVEKGSDIARSAADAIKEVVELSRQTQALIDGVRKRSDEQADSLQQVTAGLDQISTVVQQNSASAEESSAASVELTAQSHALRDVVNKSKV